MDAFARKGLLAWYDANARAMPWRACPGERPDPYAVWISEMMLQQTRVDTARAYFERWMERFPDVAMLARAPEEEVLAAWAGLGYYRRARFVHAAAQRIQVEGMPSDVEGWQSLPGIGPYASGAIASIAFGCRVPAIDGNVQRIWARMVGHEGAMDAPARGRLAADAAGWVDAARPGDWNQALMDLGATICTPRTPTCHRCPLAGACLGKDDPERYPAKPAKLPPREVAMHFAVVKDGARVLMVRGADAGLLAGMWRLPGGPAESDLVHAVELQTGLRVELGESGSAKHVFSHRIWRMQVHAAVAAGGSPRLGAQVQWIDPSADVAVPTAVRRALQALP